MNRKKNMINIYADGGCRNNKRGIENIGAWAYRIEMEDSVTEYSEPVKNTTNNKMELMAVIKALSSLDAGSTVTVWVDSQYVYKGITEWLRGWKRNGWKTANKKPVANKDLWLELESLNSLNKITWKWVKGHSGNLGNERVDYLLNQSMNTNQ